MSFKKYLDIKRQINKPEYLCNPKQMLQRFFYRNQNRTSVAVDVGAGKEDFFVNESEVIGRSILTMGVYDLVVAETIKRLIQPDDVFFDVGANIGYFSKLAALWGAQVHSYEPHPKIFERLQLNLKEQSTATLNNEALSQEEGVLTLYIPEGFEGNEGIASLEPMENSKKIDVKTRTLDSLSVEKIDLMKVDVEGHELSVFKGATQSFQQSKIKNILFEDFNGKSSPSIQFLQEHGFTVKGLLKTPFGPKLLDLDELHRQPKYEPPNFIACLDQENLKARFDSAGWSFYI